LNIVARLGECLGTVLQSGLEQLSHCAARVHRYSVHKARGGSRVVRASGWVFPMKGNAQHNRT
jgi:hypothetical protein